MAQEAEKNKSAVAGGRCKGRIYTIMSAKHGLWDFSYNVELKVKLTQIHNGVDQIPDLQMK